MRAKTIRAAQAKLLPQMNQPPNSQMQSEDTEEEGVNALRIEMPHQVVAHPRQ